MGNKKININCETNETLSLGDMIEFQGTLKTRSDNDYDMILLSIYKHGIAFPFFVWKHKGNNYVLDGHGRYEALRRIESSGEIIPPLPVVYIYAKDENHAKSLLLRLNSRYGEITLEGLKSFIEDVSINFEGINLPDLPDMERQLNEILQGSEPKYSVPPGNETMDNRMYSIVESPIGEAMGAVPPESWKMVEIPTSNETIKFMPSSNETMNFGSRIELFSIMCPECGEQYDYNRDELREAVGIDN